MRHFINNIILLQYIIWRYIKSWFLSANLQRYLKNKRLRERWAAHSTATSGQSVNRPTNGESSECVLCVLSFDRFLRRTCTPPASRVGRAQCWVAIAALAAFSRWRRIRCSSNVSGCRPVICWNPLPVRAKLPFLYALKQHRSTMQYTHQPLCSTIQVYLVECHDRPHVLLLHLQLRELLHQLLFGNLLNLHSAVRLLTETILGALVSELRTVQSVLLAIECYNL